MQEAWLTFWNKKKKYISQEKKKQQTKTIIWGGVNKQEKSLYYP